MKRRRRSSDIPESEASLPEQQACAFVATEAQIGRRHGYIMGRLFFSVLKAKKTVFAAVKQPLAESDGERGERFDASPPPFPALISAQETLNSHA